MKLTEAPSFRGFPLYDADPQAAADHKHIAHMHAFLWLPSRMRRAGRRGSGCPSRFVPAATGANTMQPRYLNPKEIAHSRAHFIGKVHSQFRELARLVGNIWHLVSDVFNYLIGA
jgi:hypothetical protein